jgi:hypothetical protein
MILNHIITAMVDDQPRRVKCLTCGSEHNHRVIRQKSAKKTGAKKRSTRSRSKSSISSRWNEAVAVWNDTTAKKYSIYESFGLEDQVTHPKFGRGVVIDIPAPDRIITLFESGEKMLLHGRKRA